MNKNQEYDNIGDKLEYGKISDDEALKICNDILEKSVFEKDDEILEAMYHTVMSGVEHYNIGDKLNIDVILEYLEKFDEEISDYIISILAYTGKKQYKKIIEEIGEKYPNLDINDAISELQFRVMN